MNLFRKWQYFPPTHWNRGGGVASTENVQFQSSWPWGILICWLWFLFINSITDFLLAADRITAITIYGVCKPVVDALRSISTKAERFVYSILLILSSIFYMVKSYMRSIWTIEKKKEKTNKSQIEFNECPLNRAMVWVSRVYSSIRYTVRDVLAWEEREKKKNDTQTLSVTSYG